MELDYRLPDRSLRRMGSLARATNTYGDRLYWSLHLADVESTWRVTLDEANPKVTIALTDGFLASGSCRIVIHALGRMKDEWFWRYTVETPTSIEEMPYADRERMDWLYGKISHVLWLSSEMDNFHAT